LIDRDNRHCDRQRAVGMQTADRGGLWRRAGGRIGGG
jgi:hypothetical protein